ncbi:DUF2142 domain-containing protein [Longispora sp. NPDC051575]|uniref:DUF2142 domain-containing protein n=1 Tax=Longispora sp. NPDC051575 TaxID=3154943 RepID=UPI003425F3EE
MRRVWLLAFLGYLLLGAGWALGVPVNGTYDEVQHIPRAYGVVTGQVYAQGYYFDGPASLLPGELTCFDKDKLAAGCQTPAPAAGTAEGDRTVRWPSAAARYSPLYYAAVGVPLAVSPDLGGIIGARVLSAALCALLLAAAVAIAYGLRNKLLVGAVLLVSTPMALNLNGSVNPNGMEISAGILAWVALLALVRSTGNERRHLVAFAVGGALLLTLRHMGPVLLAVVVLAALVFAKRGRIRELLRRADTRWALGAIVAAGILGLGWMLTSAVNDIPAIPDRAVHLSFAKTLEEIVRIRTPFYLNQVVGQFSYGELTMPGWVILGWYALVAALAVPAWLAAGRRYRIAVLGTALASYGSLVALELWFVPKLGWYSHGRYAMPAGVGLVLLAAFVAKGFTPEFPRKFVRVVVVVTGVLHVYALAEVTLRYRDQVTSMPSPAYALSAGLAGVALLGVMGWFFASTQPTPTRHDPDTPNNVGRSSEDEAGAVAH